MLFASQAALVIANARRYRDEQRARARLETLIDTSPVGVAVFDARTGAPLSFNREAVRIMEAVRLPDRPPEDLLQVLTVRRSEGQAVSLAEFPLVQALSTGETVRAEEIVLSVPDGRSITVLVNATPSRLEDDNEVETVVVTLQDMTSLNELEKMRAEFLGMVSHELRAPLTSIKGSVDTLLESFNSLDSAEMVQFLRIIKSQSDRMRDLISDLLDVARIETGMLSVTPEPVEVGDLVDEAKNTFLTGGGRRNFNIDMELDLPWVMADRRRVVQVLCNLLSNAARYSPEPSAIRVNASLGDDCVAISVADEGRGVSPEEMPLLFRKFSRNIGQGVGTRGPGHRPWPCDLQGDRGGSRRPYLGRKRRRRPGLHVHLHPAGGQQYQRGGRESQARQVATGGQRPGADSGGGRRPDGPPVCTGRPLQSGLCTGWS